MNSIKSPSLSAAPVEELDENHDLSLVKADEYIHLTKCNDEVFIANAYKYCQKCLGGSWAECSSDKFSVQYLMGGMTNYLYLCSLDDDIETKPHEPRKVLIRIYGSIVDQKHRFYEGVIFTLLSERGYGPKTLGVFYAGRIEEYIPHQRLMCFDLATSHISKLIAKRVAEYHCLKLPLNKTPTFLWEGIEKYLNKSLNVHFSKSSDRSVYESIRSTFDFENEYKWLKEMLIDIGSPVVFCHNDIQSGNILYLNGEGREKDVKLIDFDYSGYNYRGYDIGNHFGQFVYEYTVHAGDDSGDGFVLHSDEYPSRKLQYMFAEEYLDTLKTFKKKSLSENYDHQRFTSEFDICTIEELLHEVNRFALASHFHWGLWSIVQGQVSKIKFGYLKYAKSRFDEYFRLKRQLGLS